MVGKDDGEVVGAAGEGNDGSKVHEWGSVFLVVDQACLAFLVCRSCLLRLRNGRLGIAVVFFSLGGGARCVRIES